MATDCPHLARVASGTDGVKLPRAMILWPRAGSAVRAAPSRRLRR